MSQENRSQQELLKEDEKKFQNNGLRQYGVYSAIVFQMLATMGLGFWGGKQMSAYFNFEGNLFTVGIGFLGMALAFYNLLQQLKRVQGGGKRDRGSK